MGLGLGLGSRLDLAPGRPTSLQRAAMPRRGALWSTPPSRIAPGIHRVTAYVHVVTACVHMLTACVHMLTACVHMVTVCVHMVTAWVHVHVHAHVTCGCSLGTHGCGVRRGGAGPHLR